MSDEIKEILETLDKIYYNYETCNIEKYFNKIKDNITNIQQENERIKDYNDFYKELLNQSEDNIKQLIKKLEQLNNENHNLYLFIYDFILRLKHIRDNESKTYIKENLDLVIKYMDKEFKEYYKLKESGNNETI